MSYIIYTHDDFIRDIECLVNKLKDSKFKPDIIVGLVRGGAIPAVYLSHRLNAECLLINWQTRDGRIKDKGALDRVAVRAESGTKVLVVDDIVDSGATMKEVKDRTIWGTGDNMKFASLWYNPNQTTSVHYTTNIIDRSVDARWVRFPWETLI